jgi:hypothetical protein
MWAPHTKGALWLPTYKVITYKQASGARNRVSCMSQRYNLQWDKTEFQIEHKDSSIPKEVASLYNIS